MTILIETERMQLRHFTLEDINDVYTFSANEEVSRFTGDLGVVQSTADAEHVIKNIWLKEYKKYGYARYAVVCKQTQNVIGFCGFKFDEDKQQPDLGYRFMPQYWGKGYASEAIEATIAYGKNVLGLNAAVAEVYSPNIASRKLLSKFGFIETKSYIEDGNEIFCLENTNL